MLKTEISASCPSKSSSAVNSSNPQASQKYAQCPLALSYGITQTCLSSNMSHMDASKESLAVTFK